MNKRYPVGATDATATGPRDETGCRWTRIAWSAIGVLAQAFEHATVGRLGIIELRGLDQLGHSSEAVVRHDASKGTLADRTLADELMAIAA